LFGLRTAFLDLMQRPENFSLFVLLILAGVVVMAAAAITAHICARRVILRSRYLALKVCVPPLLLLSIIALFVRWPVVLSNFYSSSYGYQLQPGEPPGPLGSAGDFITVLLWLLGMACLIGYGLYVLFLFFRLWLSD
jgi:hypothetical protein